MSTQTIFQSFLLLHLIGLAMFAGITIADFITFKQFWKQYDQDQTKSLVMLPAMANLQVFMRIGILIIILAGIGLMAMTHGLFGEQLWFRIKFAFVILLILNTIFVGNRQRVKLKKTFQENNANNAGIIARIKNNLSRFYYIQLIALFIIVLLSVFKFN
jgi:uncharacterized membrane protein SirB2